MPGLRQDCDSAWAGRTALLLVAGLVVALMVGIAQPAHGHCLPEHPHATATARTWTGPAVPGHTPARTEGHLQHVGASCHGSGSGSAVALAGDVLALSLSFAPGAAVAPSPQFLETRHVLPDLKPPIG